MRVATAHRRLAARLQEVLDSGDVETVYRVTDCMRAVDSALAAYNADDQVDFAALTKDSQQAAHIVGYRPEHVRRLLRRDTLEAEKKGNAYRIPLTSVIAALEGRFAGRAEPVVLRRLRALPPVWPPPGSPPGPSASGHTRSRLQRKKPGPFRSRPSLRSTAGLATWEEARRSG